MATETLLDLIAADAVEYFCTWGEFPNSINLSATSFCQLRHPTHVFNMIVEEVDIVNMFQVYSIG